MLRVTTKPTLAVMMALLMAGAGMPLQAQDTEIYFGSSTDSVSPNILLLLDTSGSMSWAPSTSSVTSTDKRKVELMKNAINTVIDNSSNINIGLMRFSSVDGSAVMAPIRGIETDGSLLEPDGKRYSTVRSGIKPGSDDARENSSSMALTESKIEMVSGNTVGLRFQQMAIPRGAKITKAYIDFTTQPDGSAGDYQQSTSVDLRIYGEQSANAATFTTANSNISSRTKFTASTEYADWRPGTWVEGGTYRSASLVKPIQAIVNQTDWCGGNALALYITRVAGSGTRSFATYENTAGFGNYSPLAPVLTVEYAETETAAQTSSCYSGQTAVQVAGATDDGEELADGSVLLGDGDLDFRTDDIGGANTAAVAVRFTEVNVPRGAKITSASLQFVRKGATTTATAAKVFGIAQDDLPSFGTANSTFTNNTVTPKTAAVDVSFSAGAADETVSVNIAAPLEAIVQRAGWDKKKNLGFVIKSSSGDFRAYGIEGSAGNAPRLVITYQMINKPYYSGAFTVRQALKSDVVMMLADGSTPSTEALIEAYYYLAGKAVYYGKKRGAQDNTARISVPTSYSGGGGESRETNCPGRDSSDKNCASEKIEGAPVYINPITESCQTNELVFLSDGAPNDNNDVVETVRSITGNSCLLEDPNETSTRTLREDKDAKDCAYKLAAFMNDRSRVDLNPEKDGNQTARTHTIGFDLQADTAGAKYLKNLATQGGGSSHSASDADDLVKAFSSILGGTRTVNGTFATAGVTVNLQNSLTHANELYFPLFKPEITLAWPGNLKRYRLGDNGKLYDSAGVLAVDPLTGRFADNTKSYWSAAIDGTDVRAGGAAGKIPPAASVTRKVYSNLGTNKDLMATENQVRNANTGITAAMLNATSTADRTKILNWAAGYDVNAVPTDPRQEMGDPLHSSPVLLAYKTAEGPVRRVFVSTNEGFLHSIDTLETSGEEKWSFVPKELLPILTLGQKGTVPGSHVYGLDGPITLYLEDNNKDAIIDATAGEKAYLYVGMRRGGRNYYGIDISVMDQPKMLFSIVGGSGDFTSLGQSWSKATAGKIKLGGATRKVLVFGGGYDTNQDNYGGHKADSMGNTIYIVDAETGAKIWDAKTHKPLSAMTNSIPSDVALVDLKGSGFIEHLYVGDMAGQVFRFDVNPNATSASDLMKNSSGRLARLQDSTAEVDNRRFYYAPSIAYIKRKQATDFVAVSLGSGYREHPKDVVIEEHMYSLRDYGVLTGANAKDMALSDLININDYAGDSKKITEGGSLADGANGVSDAIETLDFAGNNKWGWYLPFAGQPSAIRRDGEKVVSQALTFNNVLFFNGYYPTQGATRCEPSEGRTRFYELNILGGDPKSYVPNIDGTASSFEPISRIDPRGGSNGDKDPPGMVPSGPIIVLPNGPCVMKGLECALLDQGPRLRQYKWEQLPNQ